MSRPPRHDAPGSWHHVINRGSAKRTLFETREDLRFFLSRLAWQVKRGSIAVEAYSLLSTHYHLLVQSKSGELSRAMQIIDLAYSRWFNRRRKRDGPLFRGRFLSRRVWDMNYWYVLVRYIDANAVSAGLAGNPRDYPWCSAWHYARSRGPRWLYRARIERVVSQASTRRVYDQATYDRIFSPALPPNAAWIVERTLQASGSGPSPLRDLIDAATPTVRAWMIRKAALADGATNTVPIVSPDSICKSIERQEKHTGTWQIRPRRKQISGWPILTTGLLRLGSGLTHNEIGLRLKITPSTVARHLQDYRRLISGDARMAENSAHVLVNALKTDWRRLESSWTDECGGFERGTVF